MAPARRRVDARHAHPARHAGDGDLGTQARPAGIVNRDDHPTNRHDGVDQPTTPPSSNDEPTSTAGGPRKTSRPRTRRPRHPHALAQPAPATNATPDRPPRRARTARPARGLEPARTPPARTRARRCRPRPGRSPRRHRPGTSPARDVEAVVRAQRDLPPSTPPTTENTISAPSGTGATPSAPATATWAGRRPAAGRPPHGARRGAATRRRPPASTSPADGRLHRRHDAEQRRRADLGATRANPPAPKRTATSPPAPPPPSARHELRRRHRRTPPRTVAAPPSAGEENTCPTAPQSTRPPSSAGPAARPRRPAPHTRVRTARAPRQRKKNRDVRPETPQLSCPCYIRLPLRGSSAVRQNPWSFTWSHARHSPLRIGPPRSM